MKEIKDLNLNTLIFAAPLLKKILTTENTEYTAALSFKLVKIAKKLDDILAPFEEIRTNTLQKYLDNEKYVADVPVDTSDKKEEEDEATAALPQLNQEGIDKFIKEIEEMLSSEVEPFTIPNVSIDDIGFLKINPGEIEALLWMLSE